MNGDIFYETDPNGRHWARNESPYPSKGTWRGVDFLWKYVTRRFTGQAWDGFVYQRYWIGSKGREFRTWNAAKNSLPKTPE